VARIGRDAAGLPKAAAGATSTLRAFDAILATASVQKLDKK
jgi:hypothetical protein